MKLQILLSVFLLLGFASCDLGLPTGGSDPSDPLPATEIIDVLVNPNPVRVGEITRITAIVKDSLRADLIYEWAVRGAGVIVGTDGRNVVNTDSNSIDVLASDNIGEYIGRLDVIDEGRDEGMVSFGFTIVVSSD